MIITISGNPGSGKSTIAKILVNKLNAQRIYVGGIRRELAKEKGMTLEELNEYARSHTETDVDVDKKAAAKARELEKTADIIIVEGRTQFHFLPESIKIYIKVSLTEGAKRIWKDLQNKATQQERNEGKIDSIEQMKQQIVKREEEDAYRYNKYYHLDVRDEAHYDLVLDTTNISAEEAAEKVKKFILSRSN